MGALGTAVDGVTSFVTGLGIIFAVILAIVTWPVITSTTQWMLLTVIFSTISHDVVFPDREFDWVDVIVGMVAAAVVKGVF